MITKEIVIRRLLAERDEALKERDVAREMLLSDQTHAGCGVFQKNQQRKLDEAISYPGQVTALISENERIKSERDEVIREVERMRDTVKRLCEDQVIQIESEKRRTAAYRETALRLWSGFGRREKQGAYEVDTEAKKLLADSGGRRRKANEK